MIEKPSASVGTIIVECCVWRELSGFDFPMTSINLHLGEITPVVHHFFPLRTYSSPSRLISSSIFVASDEATSGSVIAYADLISPASSGSSHSFCCSGVPYFASTSILPLSGALQLKICCAQADLDIVSKSPAISKFVKPGLHGAYSFGKNKFHSSCFFASFFRSSYQSGYCHRFS